MSSHPDNQAVGSSERTIRLMILVPSLECGGLERNIANLCNHLDVSRFNTKLVVVNNKHPFYKITNTAVDIVDLNKSKVSRAVFSIRNTIKKYNPDIVLSAANHLNLMVAILRPFLPSHIRFIARESSIVSINTARNRFAPVFNLLLRKFYHRFDCIVCQSAYMKKDLMDHYRIPEAKAVIINNFTLLPNKTIGDHSGANQKTQLISVGRLSPEKGFQRIIRSLHQLKSDFHYTIIGEGSERGVIKSLINELNMSDRVTLRGMSIHPFEEVNHADLLLMGSFYEGFPNVVLEAHARGIPVVAFNAPGGISEVVLDGKNGFLVENGNEQAFADAVYKAIDFPFQKENIRMETRKRYSSEAIMQSWIRLLFSFSPDH